MILDLRRRISEFYSSLWKNKAVRYLTLYGLLPFVILFNFVLPKLIYTSASKRVLEKYISRALHAKVTVGSFAVSLFMPGIECKNLHINDSKYKLSVDKVECSIGLISLLSGKIDMGSLLISKPILDIPVKEKERRKILRTPKRKKIKRKKSVVKRKKKKEYFVNIFSLFESLIVKDGEVRFRSKKRTVHLSEFSFSAHHKTKKKITIYVSSNLSIDNKTKSPINADFFVYLPQTFKNAKTFFSSLRYAGKIKFSSMPLQNLNNWLSLPVSFESGKVKFWGKVAGQGKNFGASWDISLLKPSLKSVKLPKAINLSLVKAKIKINKNKEELAVFLPTVSINAKKVNLKCRGGYSVSEKKAPYFFLAGKSKKIPISFIQNFISPCDEKKQAHNILHCDGWEVSGDIRNISFILDGNPAKMTNKTLFSSNSWLQAKMKLVDGKILSTPKSNIPKLYIEGDMFFKEGCVFSRNIFLKSKNSFIKNIAAVFSPKEKGGFYHLEGEGQVSVSEVFKLIGETSFGTTKENTASGRAYIDFGISHGLRSGIKALFYLNLGEAELSYASIKKERGTPLTLSTDMEIPPEGGVSICNGSIKLKESRIKFMGQRLLNTFYFLDGKNVNLSDAAALLPKINTTLKGSANLKTWIWNTPKKTLLEGNLSFYNVCYKSPQREGLEIKDCSGIIKSEGDNIFNVDLKSEYGRYKNVEARNFDVSARFIDVGFPQLEKPVFDAYIKAKSAGKIESIELNKVDVHIKGKEDVVNITLEAKSGKSGKMRLGHLKVRGNTEKLFPKTQQNTTLSMKLHLDSLKNKNMSLANIEASADLKNIDYTLETPLSNAEGSASLKTGKGTFNKFGTLDKIFTLLNPFSIFEKNISDWKYNNFPYKGITGDFSLRGGKVSTNNLLVDSKSIKLLAKGNISLDNYMLDTTVYARPFQNIDSVVGKVLSLSRVIDNERDVALLEVGFNVSGDIKSPKVELIPPYLSKSDKKIKKVSKKIKKVGEKIIKEIKRFFPF